MEVNKMDTELYYAVIKGTNIRWRYAPGYSPAIFDNEKIARETVFQAMKDLVSRVPNYVPIKISEYNRKYMDKADDSEAE